MRYLFALVDGGGTIPPELAAARGLVRRGHAVTVFADDSVEPEVRASGADFQPWVHAPNRPDRHPGSDPVRDWEVDNSHKLVDRLMATRFVGPAEGYARDIAASVANDPPHLVVCSLFCFGAMMAAEAAGVPFDVLIPNIYPLPADGLPPFGLGLRPARGAAAKIRDRAVGALAQRLGDRAGLAGLNALRARHGLAPLEHVWDQVHHARRELVMTSRQFDFLADPPPRVRYVGPVLDDPDWAVDTAWSPPPGHDPLVLVALSSTYQDQLGCLQRISDALGELQVRGLVTTGPALDPAAVRAPPNVTVLTSAPHRKVLEHATLVVTHGGHGTVMKTLAARAPMVVLPHGRDQADNAARITARGAGVMVRRTARPPVIAAAVRRVLHEPLYREAAGRLGAVIRRDAASGDLMRELEDDTGVR